MISNSNSFGGNVLWLNRLSYLTIPKRRSMHSKMATIISSSSLGAGLSSGCVHGWMIPFMSRYKLSNSTWFGFGFVASTGGRTPFSSGGYIEVGPNIF